MNSDLFKACVEKLGQAKAGRVLGFDQSVISRIVNGSRSIEKIYTRKHWAEKLVDACDGEVTIPMPGKTMKITAEELRG